mgnify:CR=1 FL=1
MNYTFMHYLPLFRFWKVRVTSIWALHGAVVYAGIKPAENVTRFAFSLLQATPCIHLYYLILSTLPTVQMKSPYTDSRYCALTRTTVTSSFVLTILIFQALTCSDNPVATPFPATRHGSHPPLLYGIYRYPS